jgi:hypothetical protein
MAYHDETLDNRIVVGAESRFVMIPWERFQKENQVMAEFSVRLDDKNLHEALKWLVREYLWSPYDYGAAASVALVERAKWLWKWVGRWFKSRFTSPRKLMCSEGMIRFLVKAGSSKFNSTDPEITNAEDLGEIYFRNPTEFKLLAAHPKLLEQHNRKV